MFTQLPTMLQATSSPAAPCGSKAKKHPISLHQSFCARGPCRAHRKAATQSSSRDNASRRFLLAGVAVAAPLLRAADCWAADETVDAEPVITNKVCAHCAALEGLGSATRPCQAQQRVPNLPPALVHNATHPPFMHVHAHTYTHMHAHAHTPCESTPAGESQIGFRLM